MYSKTIHTLSTILSQHWGYTRFVANATTLVFEYIQNSGQINDTVTLMKTGSGTIVL